MPSAPRCLISSNCSGVISAFIQTLTMTDIAAGWTACMPRVARDGCLVVEAMSGAERRFLWLMRRADFDNDSAFMNDVVVPRCQAQKIKVVRSRRLQDERLGIQYVSVCSAP